MVPTVVMQALTTYPATFSTARAPMKEVPVGTEFLVSGADVRRRGHEVAATSRPHPHAAMAALFRPLVVTAPWLDGSWRALTHAWGLISNVVSPRHAPVPSPVTRARRRLGRSLGRLAPRLSRQLASSEDGLRATSAWVGQLGQARRQPPRDLRDASHRLAATAGLVLRPYRLRARVIGDVPRGPTLIVCGVHTELDLMALLPICPAVPVIPQALAEHPMVAPVVDAFGVITQIEPRPPRAQIAAALAQRASVIVPVRAHATTAIGDLLRLAAGLGVPVCLAEIGWPGRAHVGPNTPRATLAAWRDADVTIAFAALSDDNVAPAATFAELTRRTARRPVAW